MSTCTPTARVFDLTTRRGTFWFPLVGGCSLKNDTHACDTLEILLECGVPLTARGPIDLPPLHAAAQLTDPRWAVGGRGTCDGTVRGAAKLCVPHNLFFCTTNNKKKKIGSQTMPISRKMKRDLEVYVGSVGHGVQWDAVTEYHVVPGTSRVYLYTRQPFFLARAPCPARGLVRTLLDAGAAPDAHSERGGSLPYPITALHLAAW